MTSTVNGESEKTPYEVCLDWIYARRGEVETAAYGKNKASVRDAVKEQTLKQQTILDYGETVEEMVEKTDDEVQKQGLQTAYNNLKDIAERKITCLNTMLDISTLEDHCCDMAEAFDRRAVKLVDPEQRQAAEAEGGENNLGFIAPSSQDCVFAAEDNWKWLSTLVSCINTHLTNGATYHQFFHECDESSAWMLEDLKRLHDAFEISPLKGDYQDAERLTRELKDIKVALRQWETKSDFLWEQARKVVPVQQRTTAVEDPVPARAMCNYETSEGKVRENEDLLVIDSSDPQQWKVRNARSEEFTVPAATVLIPGPFKDAIDAAVKMRLQLLAAWTDTIKRVGQRLLYFMLMVFKNNYQEDEVKTLKSIPNVEKAELGRVLDYVEETLNVHWADHQGFQALQERILMLRMMLEEGTEEETDEDQYKSLVVQILMLEKLMQNYKDLWRGWEVYKTSLEASRSPDLMLVLEKWEQLKFVDRDYFTKFWQNQLPLSDLEKTMRSIKEATEKKAAVERTQSVADEGLFEEGLFEERIEETQVSYTEAAMDEVEGSDFAMATERKTAETEQLSKAEGEETKKFIIRWVVDSISGEEISLDNAIIAGIINPSEGIYYNRKTDETYPIPVAMTAGLIKVEFTSTRRAKEKKSSFGIITVKTIRETVRPYEVVTVQDVASGELLNKAQSVERGILDETHGTFLNTSTGRRLLLADAIEQGFVVVEYEGEATEPEVVAQTYAVRAVVDRAAKKVITFADAVRRGIIDRDSGGYRDTINGEMMYIGDAIMRGFLKARKIDDVTSLDIDPENKMVIDKTEQIRKKILRPLRVLGAFKKAAALMKK